MVLGWSRSSSKAVAVTSESTSTSDSAAAAADTATTTTHTMSAANHPENTIVAADTSPSSPEVSGNLSTSSDEPMAVARTSSAAVCTDAVAATADGAVGDTSSASESTFEEDSGKMGQQSSSHEERAADVDVAVPPPVVQLFPSIASVAVGAGGISPGQQMQQQSSSHHQQQHHNHHQQQHHHHHHEKSKKMKRERSGGSSSIDDSSTGGGNNNVTRIDVYPNGESYVTTPDGTTTKTMATIQTSSTSSITASSSVPNTAGVGSAPIFQFSSTVMGVEATTTAVGLPLPAQATTTTAALNFGRGFAPGISAKQQQGRITISRSRSSAGNSSGSVAAATSITTTSATNNNNGLPSHAPLEDHSTQPVPTTNYPQDGATVAVASSSSSSFPMTADAGESSSSSSSSSAAVAAPLTINTGSSSSTINDANTSSTTTPNNNNLPNNNNNNPWQPQSQTSTCEFTHTIHNYSQKRDSGCKKAEYSTITTDTQGNKWRLIIYVNGNGRASNHHLSLFLQVADAEELPFGWNKAVSYVLTLEHPQGQSLGYAKRNPDKTFKLCPKAIDWGWSQFITSDRIQQEGYVNKDTLTVRASVTVKSSSVQIDPEDAELYLKCAVEEGNAEAVRICLGQEAWVNCQFKDDLYTPLHTACSANNHGDGSGNHHGSTISSSSSSSTPSNSPTPGPISAGCLEVLDLLLERGADVNACNKWRETPLLIAANNGHVEAVKRLLQAGADPSLCSEAGWSALTFAAHKGYDDICSLLLAANASVDCRVTEDLSTPLHKACAGSRPGHTSAVCQLLEGNADVHALNKWRETPLLTAANHGQSDAVEALLRYGADPCKCTDTGWSPLSIAAYKGHDEVVRLLLEDGAPTEEDDPTLSALLQAATKGLPDTVMLLLEHGADHTVTTKKGDTALSILVEQNLIDAAVEMVSVYNASIPRCSRDRKKVQRARLLINLRLKQMQREGTGPYCDNSDDQGESDVEPENAGGRALHDDADSAASPLTFGSKQKKKSSKSGQKSIAKQEAEARAAEEALLLELAAEECAKTENSGSKNSKKKKKKKDKERQQKADVAVEDEGIDKDKISKEVTIVAAEMPSLVKKEKVVQLTAQSVVQTLKQKKVEDNGEPSGRRIVSTPKVTPPSPSSSTQQRAIAESKVSLKRSEGDQDAKLKKAQDDPGSKPVKPMLTKKSTSSTSSNDSRNKITPHATKGQGQTKKIPGDNPVQNKKVPGDTLVAPRKVPGDNPVQPKKIPGDNPVQPKKIPGDNPKAPVQQSRGQLSSQKGGSTAPAKSQRGWESKNPTQQQATAPLATAAAVPAPNKKQPSHSNKEKAPTTKKTSQNNVAPASSKSPSSSRSDSASPTGRGKHASRSDESTHSTANSTSDSMPATPTIGQKTSSPSMGDNASAQTNTPSNVGMSVPVDEQLANLANDVLGFFDFDSSRTNGQSMAVGSMPSSPTRATSAAQPMAATVSVELPSVSIYRLEKLNEIFRHCSEARSSSLHNPLRVIDERMLRIVLYRWIIRASHGSETFLDPIIPSWDDEAYLKEFLQRQLISESRRPTGEESRYNMNVFPSIEVLRDAGAAMSEICMSIARDVVQFRFKCEQQVSHDWSDLDINMAGIEEGNQVIIEWSGKSRLSIPYLSFHALARRYVGERTRLMSAIFSAVRRHELMSAIADQTDMVCHLPFQTMECLTKGLSASLETWSDSVSVYGNNYFCSMFPDVDTVFGGLPPFGKNAGGGEKVLHRAGGAVVVVAPPENTTSSQCIRKMVDMSEQFANLPLSFGVVLSVDCFVNANISNITVEDLRALDPRLCGESKSIISFIDVIPAGGCSFSKSSTMFLLIQNEAGRLRFPAHPTAMDIIGRSMRSDMGMGNNSPMLINVPRSPGNSTFAAGASFPPMSQHQFAAGAPQEAPLSSNPWGNGGNRGGRGHRGRLFELVGDVDVEEDQGMNNLLPGMLDSLNMSMFGDSTSSNDEVDIEAISLMGIGLNGAMNSNYQQP